MVTLLRIALLVFGYSCAFAIPTTPEDVLKDAANAIVPEIVALEKDDHEKDDLLSLKPFHDAIDRADASGEEVVWPALPEAFLQVEAGSKGKYDSRLLWAEKVSLKAELAIRSKTCKPHSRIASRVNVDKCGDFFKEAGEGVLKNTAGMFGMMVQTNASEAEYEELLQEGFDFGKALSNAWNEVKKAPFIGPMATKLENTGSALAKGDIIEALGHIKEAALHKIPGYKYYKQIEAMAKQCLKCPQDNMVWVGDFLCAVPCDRVTHLTYACSSKVINHEFALLCTSNEDTCNAADLDKFIAVSEMMLNFIPGGKAAKASKDVTKVGRRLKQSGHYNELTKRFLRASFVSKFKAGGRKLATKARNGKNSWVNSQLGKMTNGLAERIMENGAVLALAHTQAGLEKDDNDILWDVMSTVDPSGVMAVAQKIVNHKGCEDELTVNDDLPGEDAGGAECDSIYIGGLPYDKMGDSCQPNYVAPYHAKPLAVPYEDGMIACFPAEATAELRDGRRVAMKDLQVGDTVRSGSDSFSEVYVFSHQLASKQSTFVEFSTQTGKSLKLSPSHFIPISKACDGATEMMHASDVIVGSCVIIADGANAMKQDKVVSHNVTVAKGLYNPFTKQGNIVVDGILASSHSEWFLDGLASMFGGKAYLPSIYQAVLAPARVMYNLAGPEVARIELERYQEQMNAYTDDNAVLAPFLDLAWRLVEIMTAQFWPCSLI